jgi:hypothetical protein
MLRPVLVLGMHRSGTSLLAELLTRWGLDAGPPDDLLSADRWNRRGYWEYMPLTRFNDALLRAINRTWSLPPGEEEDPAVAALLDEARFAAGAEALVERMNALSQAWFWKDPRLALLLPFWTRLLPQATYIVCLRNPVAVAQSLLSRDGFPLSASLLLWQVYMLKVLRHTVPSTLFVMFDHIIQNPLVACKRLSEFLDAQCAMPHSGARLATMTNVVDSTLARNYGAPELSSLPQATMEQKALWTYLVSKVEGEVETAASDRFPVYAGYREYLEAVDSLRQVSAVLQRRRRHEPG